MRFDPTVNLGHVLTFVGFVVCGFTAWGVIDKRVSILEEARHSQIARDQRQDDERAEMKKTNREDFREINAKLDKILTAAQSQVMGTGRR